MRHLGVIGLVGLIVLACRSAPKGDWGSTCERDDDCRKGLHCSIQVTDAKGHYCTDLCTVNGGGDDCEGRAPAGWSCWPILDPRDGECRK